MKVLVEGTQRFEHAALAQERAAAHGEAPDADCGKRWLPIRWLPMNPYVLCNDMMDYVRMTNKWLVLLCGAD